ncbi:MAG: hypothetical protein ACFCUT_01210 [Kiloniellaceae bacterium]
MQPLNTFAKGAAVLALGLAALAAPALADDSQLYSATSIDVKLYDPAPEITVRNVAGNHQLSALQLAVQENTIPFAIGGHVDCLGTTSENLTWRHGAYLSSGAYGIGRTSLLMSKSLPDSSNINHTSDMDAHTFQMPVGLLGNPQIGVDPVAIVLAAAEQTPSKIAYLRQDRVITVQFPIRWESTCAPYSRNKISKQTVVEANNPRSFITKDVTLKIVYQGDPQLFEVNAQLAQGGGLPNQVEVGDQPFKVTSMQFQPNMPHHVGACPATTTIRVFYQGQGKGEIRIRVNDGGSTIYNSPKIAFDSKNGKQHHDFEIATPKASIFDLNKTVAHALKVYVRGKADNEQIWPVHYQLMDQAAWNHRCTPQMNPTIGGATGSGKVAGGSQSGGAGQAPTPTLQLKQPETQPAPRIIKRAQ